MCISRPRMGTPFHVRLRLFIDEETIHHTRDAPARASGGSISSRMHGDYAADSTRARTDSTVPIAPRYISTTWARVAVRGFVGKQLLFQEFLDVDFESPKVAQDIYAIAQSHVALMARHPGLIEMEFLDESDPNHRFFRFSMHPASLLDPRLFTSRKSIN